MKDDILAYLPNEPKNELIIRYKNITVFLHVQQKTNDLLVYSQCCYTK